MQAPALNKSHSQNQPYSGPNDQQFRKACADGNTDFAQAILNKAEVDPINIINAQGQPSGNTALHQACMRKQLDAIKFLLHNHADITIKNGAGKTALELIDFSQYSTNEIKKLQELAPLVKPALNHYITANQLDLVRQLLVYKLVDQETIQAALDHAIAIGNHKAIINLINAGARVKQDSNSNHLLHLVYHAQIINDLIQRQLNDPKQAPETFDTHYQKVGQQVVTNSQALKNEVMQSIAEVKNKLDINNEASQTIDHRKLLASFQTPLLFKLVNQVLKYNLDHNLLLKACGNLSFIVAGYMSQIAQSKPDIQCEVVTFNLKNGDPKAGHSCVVINRDYVQSLLEEPNTWSNSIVIDPLFKRIFILDDLYQNTHTENQQEFAILKHYQNDPTLLAIANPASQNNYNIKAEYRFRDYPISQGLSATLANICPQQLQQHQQRYQEAFKEMEALVQGLVMRLQNQELTTVATLAV